MFTHRPLPDPTRQFRLLSFQASPPTVPVTCQLKTYPIAGSPPYYAISYHYGDSSAVETVLVNGQETQVNRNCWLALKQARSQPHVSGLFWVDSLCINQSDLEETAVQVHRIGAIFSGAHMVWASLGPPSSDSDYVLQKLKSFPSEDPTFSDSTTFGERRDDQQRRTINWLISLGDDFGRFAAALKSFGSRPFFSRVWIYQEVFLASDMRILFGNGVVDMQALHDISKVCNSLNYTYRPQHEYDYKEASMKLGALMAEHDFFVNMGHDKDLFALTNLVDQLQPERKYIKTRTFGSMWGLVELQRYFEHVQCQDPRDKVFAIIHFLGPSHTIEPDYEISCFRLALRVLSEYEAHIDGTSIDQLAGYLCQNLCLDLDSVDYDVSFARNQSPLLPGQEDGRPVLLRSIRDPVRGNWPTPLACQVLPNGAGQMTAPFIVRDDLPSIPESTFLRPIDSRTIVVDERPVAIATCSFETGDWIVPQIIHISDTHLSPGGGFCIGLVLRLRAGTKYDIVGELAFYPSCRPCGLWETCECQFGRQFHTDYFTKFYIMFDCEQLLLFTIRNRAPYVERRKTWGRACHIDAELPAGPPMNWKVSCAERYDTSKIPIQWPLY
jgi:hypothetical protein